MTGIALDSRIIEQCNQRAADGFLGLDMAVSSNAPAAKVIVLLREIVDELVAEHERIMAATVGYVGRFPLDRGATGTVLCTRLRSATGWRRGAPVAPRQTRFAV